MAILVAAGRTTEAELKFTASGTALCTFSIADTRWQRGRDGQEGQEVTTWIRVAVFGKQAESLADRISKGTVVQATGELVLNEYTNKEGVMRVTPELQFPNIRILQFPRSAAAAPVSASKEPWED
jgi:single-strand DNA-binding protein